MKCECECIFYVYADNVFFFFLLLFSSLLFCGTHEKNVCLAAARDNSICVSGKCSLFVRSLDLESLIFIPDFFFLLFLSLVAVCSFLISLCVNEWVLRLFDYDVRAMDHGRHTSGCENVRMAMLMGYTFARHTFLWPNKNVCTEGGARNDKKSFFSKPVKLN